MTDRHDGFALLDLAQEPIVVLDADGRFRYVNDAVETVLGFEPEALVGTDAFALVHPADADRLRRLFDRVVAGEIGPTSAIEHRFGTANGEWIRLRTELYPPEETGVDGYVVSSRDVTDEVATRKRLEEIAANSPDVLWMFTADWDELLFVNDAIEPVFGIDSELLAQDPTAFLGRVHPEDRPMVKDAMDRLSAGESVAIDYRVNPSTEYSTWVRVLGEPVHENGEVVRIAGYARDVSEEYRRNRQITVMDNLLRHTIRNNVNVITGTAGRIIDALVDRPDDGYTRTSNADGLENGNHADPNAGTTGDPNADTTGDPSTGRTANPDGGTVAETPVAETPVAETPVVDDVIERAETIQRVGEELLDTAEKQRDVIELLNRDGAQSTVDLAAIAEEVIGEVRRTVPAGRFVVETPEEATTRAHPKIDCALSELVENAVEHAEGTPDVRVAVDRSDDVVEITVRDNCEPIPREEMLVVTDQRKMTELYHTDGMGLWLVYWAVERSDGRLLFDTHDDGNVITLQLPNTGDESTSKSAERASHVDVVTETHD